MKQYKVTISPNAKRMLESHAFFLAKVSVTAAEEMRKRMIEDIKGLKTMPERYPYVDPDDPANPYRKMYVPSFYFVIYRIDRNEVKVDDIIDVRQNSWNELFEIPN